MTETPQQAARRLSAHMLAKGYESEALHRYTNIEGNTTHWRIRLKHPKTGDKWIRPMHLNGRGYELKEPKFENGKPLYRLHELVSNPGAGVLFVEGENKVEAAARLGILATTSGSASSDKDGNLSILAGRRVTLWPDNDEPGRAFMERMTERLVAMNCEVRVMDVAAFKLPEFYRERVDQHLRIGMRAIELLRQQRPDQLHSRKLRSFAEVAFQ